VSAIYQLPGFRFRPIEPGDWPGELTRYRQRSPFSAAWHTTLNDLERELWQLGAADKVAQVALLEGQIRQDGTPMARAIPAHPGVILSFDAKRGARGRLRFACDTYISFPDNIRAIALGMESLRRVERYGLAGDHRQYAGFLAIGPPAPKLTPQDAAERLARAARDAGLPIQASTLLIENAVRAVTWRRIAARFHPDKGGDRDYWAELMEAKMLLDGPLGAGARELQGSR
jgi:hypothetical protein